MYTSSNKKVKSINVLNRATSEVHRLYISKAKLLYNHTSLNQFQASLVLVVTWHNLRHFNLNSETRNLYNTFQAVIITDGVYTFVMYNYPPDVILWSAPTTSAKWGLYTKGNSINDPLPVVGWSAGCRREEYFNVPRSGEVMIGNISKITGKTVFGNPKKRNEFKNYSHLSQGKWLFRLETSLVKLSKDKCKSWFKKEPDPRPVLEYLEPCPCTFFQAQWDERFDVQEGWRGKSEVCAYSTFTSIDGWQQKCCYSNDGRSNGALIVGHPGGGSALRKKYVKNVISDDDKFYDRCCVQTAMCHLYYQRRPSDNCKQYEPPEWSWMWGDPHFVTLDGKNYTFNGLGEYVMLDAKDGFFELQARTRLAKGGGTATVFCAAVAKERNTSKVEISLKREGNFTLFVDGETLDYYSLTNQSTSLNGSVVVLRPKDNSFRATFPSGISVTVTEVKGALSILLAMPKSFRNQTKGLLGTWNGDQTDDLTTPSGDVLPANASSKNIHFQFGQKWQVNESTSLFTYQFNENVSTFSNTSFVPMFIEDLIEEFYNESLKQQAQAACKGDINCLFDSASTKDVSVGISTKIVGSQLVYESNTLKNSPPKFDNTSSVLYLTVNFSKSVTFKAKDPDGDKIRFNITGPPDDATVWTNESSIILKWMVTTKSVKLEIIATDNKGATSVLRPVLHVCACYNGGDCLITNQEEEEDRNNSRFSIMSCQCPSGYTGRFCESDVDACEVNMNPCYPGVQCKDLPAPANVTGYECGPCPSGFSGQGDSCLDIDECDDFVSQRCSQICANTPGSFICGCNPGYVLNEGGRSCDDVNECHPASDCMQRCVNTPGSYTCTCDKYFTVDPTNPKRCIPESPCKDGNHQCQDICYVSNGTDHCTCHPGYELQHDNKSCTDIDECTTGKNRCNQECRNIIGWYDCKCRPGYRLDTDNVTCIDIDECLEWTFNCSANLRCRNTIGSYECECRIGLVWKGNECQEPEKPATTSPPSTPRPPSKRDIQNSVNVTIKGLDITEALHWCNLHNTRSSSSARLPSTVVLLFHP
ncbi:mucin-like protein isoform X2 [Actinia tenebrosa]|uniref:Mucin-like protein isoform X2 n=1 Tax=Actinia tenebrosa TaxID=6105 RepID=A0A6P8H7J5_ACTTE|nr:mucin-like protein isoform X2 [Actinia tenebrosa]